LHTVAGSFGYFSARRLKFVQAVERCSAKFRIADSAQLSAQSDFRIDLNRHQETPYENALVGFSFQHVTQALPATIMKPFIMLDYAQDFFRQCFAIATGQHSLLYFRKRRR